MGKAITMLRSAANASLAAVAAASAPTAVVFQEGRSALSTSDGRYELRWDKGFQTLAFKDKAAMQVLWSVLVRVPAAAPVRLTMASSGELLLVDAAAQLLWSSGSKGVGRPPHVLQILDGSLLVADSTGATTWLANATCPAGTQLGAWAQCGGTSCRAGTSFPCNDAQYPGTCCPAGWQCQRQAAASWRCMPTAALGRCMGAKTLPVGQLCGGTAACAADATCSTSTCCVAGSVCQRRSAARWECTALPAQPRT
jgi:hypothetical protein